MQLSFPSDKSTELSFKVGIAGTQTLPTVDVVLERDGKTLTYKAEQRGDEWFAIIQKPGSVFNEGDVKVSVNVLLNNRLFTPLKSIATIIGETVGSEPMKDAVSDVPPVEVTPVVPPVVEATPVPEQVVPEPVLAVVKPVETEEQKKKKVKDLLAKAQAQHTAKRQSESAPIRMGLLKSVEPVAIAPVVEATPKPKKKHAKKADLFTIKKTGTRVI